MNITFNGFAERLTELEDLYLSIQKVSGFTVEQLLEAFMAGYAIDKPKIKSEKKEAYAMQVSYNGFTGELVKLGRNPDMKMCHGYIYDISIYDSEKQVTHSFTGVKLEDVKFLGGAVSFGG